MGGTMLYSTNLSIRIQVPNARAVTASRHCVPSGMRRLGLQPVRGRVLCRRKDSYRRRDVPEVAVSSTSLPLLTAQLQFLSININNTLEVLSESWFSSLPFSQVFGQLFPTVDEAVIDTKDTTESKQGSLFGATALITGSCVGAGVLALPAKTNAAGFIPSVSILVGCWIFLTIEAILISEINLYCTQSLKSSRKNKGEIISINDMAQTTMGTAGSVITSSTYILLTYTLMVAYISKAGDVLAAQLPFPVSPQAMGLTFATGFGAAIALGDIKKADELNRLLTLGMLSSFALICGCGFLHLDTSQLLAASWSDALSPIPVVFLSLVYHDLVPVLCSYLGEDRQRIRQAIVVGSAIPLAMFISWEAVALGLTSGEIDGDPIQILSSSNGAFAPVFNLFSILAISTSFISSTISSVEFFVNEISNSTRFFQKGDSGLDLKRGQALDVDLESMVKEGREKVTLRLSAFGISLVPPVLISYFNPGLFFKASTIAGGLGMTFAWGVLPPLMAWNIRDKLGNSVPGCTPIVLALGGSAVGLIFQQMLTIDF